MMEQNLTKAIIEMQHQQRLMEKKLDVVGILQSKAQQTYQVLDASVQNQNALLKEIDYASAIQNNDQLHDYILTLKGQRMDIHEDMGKIIERVGQMQKDMDITHQHLKQTLDAQGESQDFASQAILEALFNNQKEMTEYVDAKELKAMFKQMETVQQDFDEMASKHKQTQDQTKEVLDQMTYRLEAMSESSRSLATLQAGNIDLLKKANQLLARIDEQLSDVVPSYLEPSTEEILSSYEQLANESSLDETLNESALEVPSNESVSEVPLNESVLEEPSAEEPLQDEEVEEVVEELTDQPVTEVPREVIISLPQDKVSYKDYQPEQAPKKKSFFEKLFG